jgi:subtilisin-like proprotein convertase family protein
MSKDGPKTILEQSNVVRSTITITEDAEIADLNLINIRGTHSWISDLEFRLIGPNGQKIDLLINACEDEENFNISFDDESTNINLDCPPLNGKAYKPRQSLNLFDGLSSKGDWILEITDDVFLDGGIFESWTLELCLIEKKSNRSFSVTPKSIEICQNTFEPILISATLNGAFDDNVSVSLANSATNAIIGESINVNSDAEVKIALTDFTSLLANNASLIFRIVDSTGTQTVNIPVSFVKENISVSSQEPIDKATGVEVSPQFRWSTGSGSKMTTLQLYNANGSAIWDTTITQGSSIVLPFKLDQLTSYSWDIGTIGSCSPYETSSRYSFTTTMSVATDDPDMQGIRIYPNPTSFNFIITKDNSWNSNAQLRMYSINGQLMSTTKLSSSRQDMDVSNMNEGLYILEIINGDKVSTQKLIINR